jgi:hypothetical protein
MTDPFNSNSIFPTAVDTFPNLADYNSVAAASLPKYHTKLWASSYNKMVNFINTAQGLLTTKPPTLANTFKLTQPFQVFSLPLVDVLKQFDPWVYNNNFAPGNVLNFEVIISSTDQSWKFSTGRTSSQEFYSYKTTQNLTELFGTINVFQGNVLCSAAIDLNYETLSNKTAGYQDNFIVTSYVTVNNTNTLIVRGTVLDTYLYNDPKPGGTPNGLVVGGSLGTQLPTLTNTNWLAMVGQRKLTINLMGVQ